jgi:hypothetical protein
MSVHVLKRKVNEEFNLENLLDDASGPTDSKAKKSSVPIVPTSVEVQQLATEIRDLKILFDNTKTELEAKSEELRISVKPLRDNLCNKSYLSSVKITDTKQRPMTLSWSDSYSPIAVDNKDTLKDIVKGKYADFFEETRSASLRDMTNEGLEEFIKILGPENFKRFVEVKRNIKPTTSFTQNQFSLTEDQRQKLDLYVKQYKAAIK